MNKEQLPSTSARASAPANQVNFTFDQVDDKKSEFLEAVSYGGLCYQQEFWNSPLVKNIGATEIRPGRNDYSDQVCYYFRRSNKKCDKSSIVELEQRFYSELADWLHLRFSELKNFNESTGLVGILAENPKFASQERINGDRDWPSDFFNNPLTLTLGRFRIRPHYDTKFGSICFIMNSKREFAGNAAWHGPTIVWNIGELRRAMVALSVFQDQF